MSVVTDYLEAHLGPYTPLWHEPSSPEISPDEFISADLVLKTIAIVTADGYAFVVAPASHRLDMNLVRDAVGDPHARLATEDELAQDFPDVELGGLPPLGSLLHGPVYMDPIVVDHSHVVFAAGSDDHKVRVRTAQLLHHESVTITPLVQRAAWAREPV